MSYTLPTAALHVIVCCPLASFDEQIASDIGSSVAYGRRTRNLEIIVHEGLQDFGGRRDGVHPGIRERIA